MKRLRELNKYRDKTWERMLGVQGDDFCGCFRVPNGRGTDLRCLVGTGEGWDHVSVSVELPRCPSWEEMELVKRTFFKEDEVAFQLHVTPKEHVSVHHGCLHIWRPHHAPIPLPPVWMVA